MRVETNWHRLYSFSFLLDFIKNVNSRHDCTDPQASFKPLQVGTKLFVEELNKRFFSNSDDIIMKVSFHQKWSY